MRQNANLDQMYLNIEISSRYNLLDEIEDIKEIIKGLSFTARLQLHSVWCDSKATACYSIEASAGADLDALKWELYDLFRREQMGHNGIDVHSKDESVHLDPDWPGDEIF